MTKATEDPKTVHVHIFVSGGVQGIGYRFSAAKEARRLKINGWIQNLADGRVEAVLEGDRPTVDKMLDWCRQGPPAAAVTGVEVYYGNLENFSSFEIR